jgi:hypothetical protein
MKTLYGHNIKGTCDVDKEPCDGKRYTCRREKIRDRFPNCLCLSFKEEA